MCDEAQPGFAPLQLSEHHVVGTNTGGHSFQIPNVPGLPKHLGVADDG